MNARLNLLSGAAAGMILAMLHGERAWVVVALVVAALIVLFVVSLPPTRRTTPRTITRLPTRHERSGSKWLPGIFVRIPGIPFLSIGLFRWRGRK